MRCRKMAFSDKQMQVLRFPYQSYSALICDGAVRSGKTSVMSLSFFLWAMSRFSGCAFGFCGKSVGSVERNIVTPLLAVRYLQEHFSIRYNRGAHAIIARRGRRENRFYLFGGKDESSYTLIQGVTLAGVLLDEAALMPRSFVEQALARCSVHGAKFWFNCNPENPAHWFYQEWILHPEAHNALHIHFLMEDNPSLSKETRQLYETTYSGVFYRRYVLGEWIPADGLVYPMFEEERHVIRGEPPETEGDYYVSADYGIQNPNVFLLWRRERGAKRWICLKEDYYSGREEHRQLTDGELVDRLNAMLGGVRPKRVILDPSAASLKAELQRRGYHVQNARNEVLDGISDVCSMLKLGGLAFMACCERTVKEFGAYLWDGDAVDRGQDAPMKESDHAMDACRYFVRTMRLLKRADRGGEPH